MTTPEPRVAPAGGAPPRDTLLTVAVAAALVVTVGSLIAVDQLIGLAKDAANVLTFPYR